jgi:glycine betaine/choline ABC-type transport system substrate-binding protein
MVALALLLASCRGPGAEVRVGAKDFAEQAILAEMVVQLLRADGMRASVQRCGDTYGCHRALQDGEADVMVEYTGTGLSFLGELPPSGNELETPARSSVERARLLFAPLGISWLAPLGFDNGYRLLVTSERSSLQGLSSIADLAKLGGVRVTCPSEYLRRPLDGLDSLIKRYGLRLRGQPLLIEEVGKRYEALLDGRADVAVGYATDGVLESLGLKVLEDVLAFFPPYDAVVIARTARLQSDPALEKTLRKLARRIDTATMRRLNYQVEVEGHPARAVATRFLRRRKLTRVKPSPGPGLNVAVHRHDSLDPLVTRAIRAVRAVFPEMPVTTRRVADPAREVAAGRARIAVVGAERFFRAAGDGAPRRESRLEALTVLATRMLHLVRRRDDHGGDALRGRVGVGESGSGGAMVADELLGMANHEPAAYAKIPSLLRQVASGKLDAALVLALPGQKELLSLDRLGLELRPLRKIGARKGVLVLERVVLQPYLRPARIPAETYRGQPEVIDTLGSQVVLAGPPSSQPPTPSGGPAAALPMGSQPFKPGEVRQLARAAKAFEAPDPVLPSAWTVRPGQHVDRPRDVTGTALDTVLNGVAVAFLVWLVILIRRQ